MISEAGERTVDLVSKTWVKISFWPFLAQPIHVMSFVASELFLTLVMGNVIMLVIMVTEEAAALYIEVLCRGHTK